MRDYKADGNVHFLGVVRLRDKLVAASLTYGRSVDCHPKLIGDCDCNH